MDSARSTCSERGFSLVETLVSVGLLTAVAIGVAQLFAVSTAANVSAKGSTSTALLAAQKLEQLRGLDWRYDEIGLPLSDTTTDLSTDPPTGGGRGLAPSPGTALNQNEQGYVDYLDASGRWIGTGTTPPGGTSYVRRWSVEPLPTDPSNTLVLQTRVIPLSRVQRLAPRGEGRGLDEAWLVTVKTRKAP